MNPLLSHRQIIIKENAQLNISKEILVNVDELQQQYLINFGSHVCFEEDLEESEPCDYICPSGLAILCCLPFGLCAMWAADSGIKSWDSGDHEKAKKKNNIALWLIVAATLIGSSLWLTGLLYINQIGQ
ncbi:uncharacterized protein LOC127704643 isoform X2 [Mytilus californianus]|uniref:uncharacterized protein LOC127704643 isoform X2 n=1 Tax=Mytilus californianus TaxID=6549 RepID=UPI0022467ECA|nr:uncharacterized protein LOC127704643 isoform X2 [Mytilus californianus]